MVTVDTRLLLPSREVGPGQLEPYRRFLANALAQTKIWFDLADSTAGGAR
jgi:hypothetical protein